MSLRRQFLLLSVLLVPTALVAQPPVPAEPDQAALEKAFAEKLSGSTLVGSFTVTRANGPREPKEERYELGPVTKLEGNLWVFTARIKYGDTDVKLPITLPVQWAGDTPVITMTNQTIPGLGTFTCRVLFYRDRYVGTWQHDAVGGHLFGTIEKPKNDPSAEPNR